MEVAEVLALPAGLALHLLRDGPELQPPESHAAQHALVCAGHVSRGQAALLLQPLAQRGEQGAALGSRQGCRQTRGWLNNLEGTHLLTLGAPSSMPGAHAAVQCCQQQAESAASSSGAKGY